MWAYWLLLALFQEIQTKCEKIDDVYKQKDQDLREHYSRLEKLLQ